MRAVLTFHSIDDSGSMLSFAPARFAELIESLARSGVPVVAFDDLLRLREGIAITFDDGMATLHRHALPVLHDHGFPAHLFLTTGAVGSDNMWPSQPRAAPHFDMLDWRQVEDCAAQGLLVESHTATHPDLRTLDDARIVDECRVADEEIERRLGRRPRLFAYPYGFADERVRRVVAPLYAGCFSTRLDYLRDQADLSDLSDLPRLDTYFLRAPTLFRHLLSAPVHSYIGLRAAIRRIRGRT